MFAALSESFRKATDSTLHVQGEIFQSWAKAWFFPLGGMDTSPDGWGPALRRRWLQLTLDMLNKQREALDATYRSGIGILEQGLRLSESSSANDYQRVATEIWRRMSSEYRTQSEVQLQDLQKWVEESFATLQSGRA